MLHSITAYALPEALSSQCACGLEVQCLRSRCSVFSWCVLDISTIKVLIPEQQIQGVGIATERQYP